MDLLVAIIVSSRPAPLGYQSDGDEINTKQKDYENQESGHKQFRPRDVVENFKNKLSKPGLRHTVTSYANRLGKNSHQWKH